jgi:hypothetical protein
MVSEAPAACASLQEFLAGYERDVEALMTATGSAEGWRAGPSYGGGWDGPEDPAVG